MMEMIEIPWGMLVVSRLSNKSNQRNSVEWNGMESNGESKMNA
jgi:hypothetical protein